MFRSVFAGVFSAILSVGVCNCSQAQSELDERELSRRAGMLAAKEAERYEIVVGATATPAVLDRSALLHWGNPLDAVHGAVHCWCVDRRPVAIASFYKYFTGDQKFSAEFQSLTSSPIAGERDSNSYWNCQEPGLQFHEVPNAVPARSKSQQFLQMRQIARRFAAEVKTWDSGETRNLRLLSKPLLTYGEEDRESVGGLFAFVVATDPDALLIIEAVEAGDRRFWRYGLARLSINETTVRLDQETVWAVPKQSSPFERPKEPYTILQAIDEPVVDFSVNE